MGTTAINLGSGDKLNNSPVSYVTLKEVKNGVAVFTNERNLEYEARLEKEREEYRNTPQKYIYVDFDNVKKATKTICKHLNELGIEYNYNNYEFDNISTGNYSISIDDNIVSVSVDTEGMYHYNIEEIYEIAKDANEISDWIKENKLVGNKSKHKTIMKTPKEYRTYNYKQINDINKKLHKL